MASRAERRLPVQQVFQAANGTKINVYKRKTVKVDFGLRRDFSFPFYVCNVSCNIIGADFLHNFNLKPDLRNRKIIDSCTNLNTNGLLKECNIFSVKSFTDDSVFMKLLSEFPSVTKLPDPNHPVKHNTMHFIQTHGPPVVCKPRRLAPDRLKIAKREIQHMLELGHMRPSKSNFASPLHLVPKKNSSDWRPVGDFRLLNAQTVKDKYCLPTVSDFTAELHGCKIFSHIDLVKAYHQIPINPADIHKTAICCPFGTFESTRMQFGLCNASATFQRFIDEITRDLHGVFAFVDDILIASSNSDEHLNHLKCLFTRLDKYGLCINLAKCEFGKSSLEFLGFLVSEHGIKPLPDRVKAIQNFPQPNSLTQLRRFLGLFNFYRRFVPKAAHILAPLNQLLQGKKNKTRVPKKHEPPLEWNEVAEQAFLKAKTALAEATLLRHPIPNAKLSLWTDASDVAIGSTLMQFSNNSWEPLAFLSMKLDKSQKKWSTYDRELLAIYSSIKKFRHMLEGRRFTIFTDQKPLIFAFKQKSEKCSPRQLRHLDFISQFSTDIQHVSGESNTIADALSRVEIDSISKIPVLNYKFLAEEQLRDEELQKLLESNSLGLKKHYFPLEDIELFCDSTTKHPRPFIPTSYRSVIFENLHYFSHPGISATTKLISSRFIWPGMRKDIKARVLNCNKCQRAKVFRHTKAPLGTFSQPDARFSHIHIDFIGPLPPSDGMRYCMTIIDRFTRWSEVIPTTDMLAETTARALLHHWISRFGSPVTITTDQGKNFESHLFRELTNILGSHRIHSSSYHPQSNGMIERLHRHLKGALRAHENPKWTDVLPIVLLGLRTAVKNDLNATSAQLVYGTNLRLPSDLLSNESYKQPISPNYVSNLISMMRKINPVTSPSHGNSKVFVNKALKDCSHVFLRIDKIHPSLTSPYSGPHLVIDRNDKNFVLDLNGKKTTISIDRLKPAFELNDDFKSAKMPLLPNPTKVIEKSHPVKSIVTRSGRKVHFPKKFVQYI